MTSLAAQKKRQQSADNKVIAQAVIWAMRYDLQTVASLVWNKYGYQADVLNGGYTLALGGAMGGKHAYYVDFYYMTPAEMRQAQEESEAASAASEREAELRNESILAGEYIGSLPGDEAEDGAEQIYMDRIRREGAAAVRRGLASLETW